MKRTNHNHQLNNDPAGSPPRWAEKLLSTWGDPNTREEVQGDLLELYAYWAKTVGERKARWRYIISVLKLLRPLAKPKRITTRQPTTYATPDYQTTFLLSPAMLRNYLKIAWRNLAKNKVYSFINIAGLAMGMALAMLIGLWLYDELSFNKSFDQYESIAHVKQNQTFNGKIDTWAALPLPTGNELRAHYGSNFKHVVMSSWTDEHILATADKKLTKSGNYMEPDGPDLFSLRMLSGTRAGLKDPHSILLSESFAHACFGDEDPLGKIIRVDNDADVKVTGIYKDFPHNSDLSTVAYIMPWALRLSTNKLMGDLKDEWGASAVQVFVQIADHTDIARVSAKIRDVKLNKIAKEDQKLKPELFLHPMSDWHLYNEFKNGVNTGGRIDYIWMFGSIGVFVLLLACINFMNLSTARSEKRAKEVGIRKAVGSVRGQLISQFFSESLLVVAFAFTLSLLLVRLTLPLFNEVADKRLTILWLNPVFWLFGVGFSLLTGVIAGSYPAFYLSSFQPVDVLKGPGSSSRFRIGHFASIPRRVLVVIQFTISVFLIIGTIIVFRQIQFAKNRPIGYSRSGLIWVSLTTDEIRSRFTAIRDELKTTGAVADVAQSESPMTAVWATNGGFDWKGKDPSLAVDFPNTGVSADYGKTVGWQFKEGRDFSRDIVSDSSAFVINEAAAKFMSLKNPVGEIIKWDGNPFKVIGVIKDVVVESPYDPVRPSIFCIARDHDNFAVIKLNPASSTPDALQKIEAIVKKYAPATPFDYKFVDQEYARKFGNEERIGKLASFFATLAIFISCLGLFGLAAFMAEQRTKEIGVRKVLGASVLDVWGLLSKDFVVLVSIAFGIAVPTAHYFLSQWLQKYMYHTEIAWWIFAVTGLGTLSVTLLTISFQSIKAALMNPVKSLRSE